MDKKIKKIKFICSIIMILIIFIAPTLEMKFGLNKFYTMMFILILNIILVPVFDLINYKKIKNTYTEKEKNKEMVKIKISFSIVVIFLLIIFMFFNK